MTTATAPPNVTRIFDGKLIKALRKKRGLTVDKLAGDAGTNRPNLENIEDKGQLPKSDLMGRLADALDVSTEAFYKHKP